MPMTPSEIVEKAEQLALSLTAGPVVVGKNVLLGLTAEYLSAPRPDRERLRSTVKLVAQGSGGHLKRGGGYGDQVRLAATEITQVLEDDLNDQELKSLLGWTARLLLVRRAPGDPQTRNEARAGSGPSKEEVRRELPKPIQKNVLRNALLKLAQGSATAFRGDKAVAICRPEDLDSELLNALKRNPRGLRADIEVVKAGNTSRIVGVPKWEPAK